jgi:hypothetical protein
MTLVAFIIPVRHQDNARDWNALTDKLSQTARSIANQTHSNWRAIVVANEGARLPQLPKGFTVVRVGFPPNTMPELSKGPREAVLDAFRADKGRRVLSGMLAARDSRFFMIVDDDDLVSSRIVEHASKHPDSNGWYIDKGYLWDDGGSFIFAIDDFNRRCGTSLIVRSDLYGLPDRVESASLDWIKTMLGSHVRIDGILEERGQPLAPLPFRAGIYRVGNAGSHSQTPGVIRLKLLNRMTLRQPRMFFANLDRLRRVDANVRREFFGA